MACPEQVILPEVHLDSPIVRNKLFYYLKVGGLPTSDESICDTLFPNISWDRVRREESRLSARLQKVRQLSHSRLRSPINTLKNSADSPDIEVILWPEIIPNLKQYTLTSCLSRFTDAEKCLISAMSPLVPGTKLLLGEMCKKVSGKDTLVTNNTRACRFHEQHTRPQSALDFCQIYDANEYKDTFYTWFLIRHQMRALILKTQTNLSIDLITILDERDFCFIVTPELVTLVDRKESRMSYFTFEMTLMVTDMIEGRMNILAISSASCYLQPLKTHLRYLFDIVDHLCAILGQNVYSLIANLESMVYAVLQLSDPVPDLKGEFLSFINSEIYTILVDSGEFTDDEAYAVIDKLNSCYLHLPADLVAELLCIMRLWGHPMLTSATAARKVRESMCAPKVIDLTTNLKTLAFFNGIIINGYRRRHDGIWPNCTLPPFASLSLQELRHDNSELSYPYILAHWKEIAMLEFGKSIDADPGEDLSIFMKDKAISAPKKDWLSVFRKSLIKQQCEQCKIPLPQPYNRRLLLNFLADETFDPLKELEYVTSGAYLDDDSFCASYSLKEKEIKETGRIFAKLTKNMRSCQVIAESLLAAHAGKFFKENGVVLDQISITKTLLTMSQIGIISKHSRRTTRNNITVLSKSERHRLSRHETNANLSPGKKEIPSETTEITACFLTTDLSKYCLNWRYQSIILFAKSMNQLYGYNHLFEWIHLRLMRSTLYVGDPFNPPRNLTSADLDLVENGDIFIVSPRGGIEGLCQKLWTMISIAVIVLSATEAGTRVMSLVQGDNQAMAITTMIPRGLPHHEKKRIAYENSQTFIRRLRENNLGMGHHLKEQETIVSSEFLIYSKRIIYNGRILNQSLKNVSKLCLIADILGESTQTSCSNLATTVMRLTENGIEKDICFFLNQYLTAKQLVFDLLFPLTKLFEDQTSSAFLDHPILVSRLITIPAQLGGLNYYALTRLFNRNIGDPLTSAIADLKRYIMAGMLPRWILKNLIAREPGDGDWNTLASDPYALNIDYLYPPTTFLKKHAQRVLMEGSVNPMLSGVFSESNLPEENSLARFLLDRDVVMPRVAHIVLEQSVCGRKKQIQGYLDTTRTIIRYAINRQPIGNAKLCKILDYNTSYLSYNLDHISTPVNCVTISMSSSSLLKLCSIDLARLVRRLSWKSLLGGRQLDGLETPDPIELVEGALLTKGSVCTHCMSGNRKYTWFFVPAGIDITADPADNPPVRVPYIGSRTDERRVASMSYVKGSSSALKAALRLCGVYIWAFGDTEKNWIDAAQLANTRAHLSLDQLHVLTPLPTTANLTHRLDDGLTQQKFTPASSYMYSSYVHISNDDQNLEIQDRTVDSNLIYQQIMLLGLGIIETWLQLPNEINIDDSTLHLHTECSCCIKQVDACIINEVETNVPTLSIPQYNKFIYDTNPLTDQNIQEIDKLQFEAEISGIDAIPDQDKVRVLGHLTGLQLARSITGLDEVTSLMNDAIVEADYSANWISECLNTKLDDTFIYAAWNLLLDLSYQLYYLRILGQNAILDYLSIVLSRIPGLALSGIAATISHPKILRRLINLEVVRPYNSPYLATLNYTKLTCDALMWGARHVLSNIRSGFDIEIIIPSECSSELSDRVLNLIARKLSLLCCLTASHHELPHVRGLSPELKCKVLTEYLLLKKNEYSTAVGDVRGWETSILEPKISAFPCNIYYLTRKVLNYIRDSPFLQQQLTDYYDIRSSIYSNVPIGGNGAGDSISESPSTLCVLDWLIPLFSQTDKLVKFHTPLTDSSPVDRQPTIVDPPIHHILRPVGLSSTSWYKGLSVIKVLDTLPVLSGNHLYLAEGSGAMMTVIESKYCGTKAFYNSLFSSGQNPPQRNFQPLPTQFMESIVYQNIHHEEEQMGTDEPFFVPLWSGSSEETDLSCAACVNLILKSIPSRSVSIMNVDLEDITQMQNLEISRAAVNVILLSDILLMPGGILIFKTYLSPFAKLSKFCKLLHIAFSRCILLRSAYSDPASDEVFLVAIKSDSRSLTGSFDEITAQLQIDDKSFTCIKPETLTQIIDKLNNQQQRVKDLIDNQVRTGRCDVNIDDHIQLGTSSQTPKILDLEIAFDFNDFIVRVVQMLTTFLKEFISIHDDLATDRNSLLFDSYNLDRKGKLSTNNQIVTSHIMNLTARNWPLLPPAVNGQVRNNLELGIFQCNSIVSWEVFLNLTPIRKHILKRIGSQIVRDLFTYHLIIKLDRAEQKRVWKAIGSVILSFTLDNDIPEHHPILFEDPDIPEFDIFGEEL
uniref:RNA-directed RNA polymerase L n=1 Tax=Tioman virus TaxID=162013 RepID=A0A2L2PA96_9MONO|nr:RNA polymerase [Tioman virus]